MCSMTDDPSMHDAEKAPTTEPREWSAAATRFRDAHDATVARMQDRSISPTQHWPIFAEEVARLTPAATDTGLRAALDAIEHLSHDNPHQFPPAENYRIWMREINARARAALALPVPTPAETGLDAAEIEPVMHPNAYDLDLDGEQ